MVYYSAGESITTPIPAGLITSANLYLWRGAVNVSTIATGGVLPDLLFNVGASYFANAPVSGVLGNYTWDVRATLAPDGTLKTSSNNPLTLNCNRIQIVSLTVENGGGINAPDIVRSINVSGTQIRVQANLQNGGGAMVGNTTFRIVDDQTPANVYLLQINGGQNQGTVLVDPLPTVGVNSNILVNYTVEAVYGGAYDGDYTANLGQYQPGRIVNSGPFQCRWENAHWPGYGSTPFTPQLGTLPPTSTASGFTLLWTPLTNANAAPWDADFRTYRVYYKRQVDTAWMILDSSNVPALGLIGTGTLNVGGMTNPLEPLTAYDYRISAIDVFGNEVLLANQIVGNLTTAAITIEAKIDDGITSFDNVSFSGSPANPANHVVRDTAIKVTVYLVTTGAMPERVSIVIAGNDSDLPAQYGLPTGSVDDITTLMEGASKWSVPCMKVAPNTYEALISSEHPVMAMGANARFIVETVIGGVTAYYDHTPDAAPPGNWWNDEWRFRVSQPVNFFPWPTRVLNNVLTSTMPCCFPAYYLTIDSLVTIKVYDVKGRVIMVLAENLYRPGGQNIKDNGWCGTNKDNRRVGPGLYYIHIKATTFGNKVTLDKILKVVVAH